MVNTVVPAPPLRRASSHRLTGVTRYPRWGAEVGTPDMYNPHATGNTPFSYLGALAAAGMLDCYENSPQGSSRLHSSCPPSSPRTPYPVSPHSDAGPVPTVGPYRFVVPASPLRRAVPRSGTHGARAGCAATTQTHDTTTPCRVRPLWAPAGVDGGVASPVTTSRTLLAVPGYIPGMPLSALP